MNTTLMAAFADGTIHEIQTIEEELCIVVRTLLRIFAEKSYFDDSLSFSVSLGTEIDPDTAHF